MAARSRESRTRRTRGAREWRRARPRAFRASDGAFRFARNRRSRRRASRRSRQRLQARSARFRSLGVRLASPRPPSCAARARSRRRGAWGAARRRARRAGETRALRTWEARQRPALTSRSASSSIVRVPGASHAMSPARDARGSSSQPLASNAAEEKTRAVAKASSRRSFRADLRSSRLRTSQDAKGRIANEAHPGAS